MPQYEYLAIKIMGSKGCINTDSLKEMTWNNVRLLTTENGVTTVQRLAGGIERMEELLNNKLDSYKEQGWQTVKVERPTESNQSLYPRTTIQCLLKRPMQIEHTIRLARPNSTQTDQVLSSRM